MKSDNWCPLKAENHFSDSETASVIVKEMPNGLKSELGALLVKILALWNRGLFLLKFFSPDLGVVLQNLLKRQMNQVFSVKDEFVYYIHNRRKKFEAGGPDHDHKEGLSRHPGQIKRQPITRSYL